MPPDKEGETRSGGGTGGQIVGLLVLALLVTFFVSPAWFLDFILPASVDSSWARYDTAFQGGLLVPLILLMSARLALFTIAVYNEHWCARTEPLRFGLWVMFIGLLIWTLIGWDIFASPTVDFIFKAWLSIFVLVNGIVIVVFLRRALTRVHVPKTLGNGGDS